MDYGLIVDVETTGLDAKKDKIIEIGICEFGWQKDRQPVVLGLYGGLEDPGRPLPQEIVKLTGITDDALAGQAINWDVVRSAWNRASIIVAHNAEFDRSFLNRRPELQGLHKHWACSVKHIDWHTLGFGSRKLTYLAADHGFVNPFAHRALFDCATTFRLIAPHLSQLVANSFDPEIRFIAWNSPFESKDSLKARGYRWDVELRVWHRTVMSRQADDERLYLATDVYKGMTRHVEETILFNPPVDSSAPIVQ